MIVGLNLSDERDISKLFDRFKEIIERRLDTQTKTANEVLSNRLAFIIGGAPSSTRMEG